MKLIFALALRNALRNRRRSIVTALTVTFGIALLMCGLAWIRGVMGGTLSSAAQIAGHVRVVQPAYSQKEQLFPINANIPDAAPVLAAVQKVPGVKAAYVRVQMPVTLSASDEIGEHFTLLQGADNSWYTEIIHLDEHLEEGGHLPTGEKEVVLGKEAAKQAGAKLGDKVTVLGQTQDGALSGARLLVVGIADMGNKMQNSISYGTLGEVQYLTDIEGGALEILAYADSPEDANGVAATMRADAAFKDYAVEAWDERSPYNGMVGLSGAISAIAIGCITFITALGVLNTMFMSVAERTGEIGVLRAMGLKKVETMAMFVIEALGIASIGGVLGATGGGLLAYFWLQQHGINLGSAAKSFPSSMPVNTVVHGQVTPELLVQGMLIGLVMAVIGSVIPAWRASEIQPVEAMRSRK